MSGDLWTCPRCGRTFANRNQTHTCAPLGDLDRLFVGTEPQVREAFDAVIAALPGPVQILAEKTRIALHIRMSFAAFLPRRRWLDGHLVLDVPAESARFRSVQVFSPRNVLHTFRLTSGAEVDTEFIGWLERAYRVGEQRHLRRASDQSDR